MIIRSDSALRNNAEIRSTQRRKRKGDRGSLCLRPLLGIIHPFGSLLSRTEYETEEMHSMIREVHWKLNPILIIIASKYPHSTRSYALLMSSLTAINLDPPLRLFFRECSISNATRMLSEIKRPGTKALWLSEIISGIIDLNLFDRSLETILYSTLHKLIGRSWDKHFGDFIFEISAIWVRLIDLRILPEFKQSGTTSVISLPTID